MGMKQVGCGLVRTMIGVMVTVLVVSTAKAGRNANGSMIVHTNDAYLYSSADACTTPLGNPGTCTAANTQTNKSAGSVIWVLASFDPTSSPGVTLVYFGIQYDDVNLQIAQAQRCGPGVLELPSDGWPESCSGNVVNLDPPVISTLFPFYVFEVENPSGTAGAFFSTTVHPDTGYAAFVDDSNPPVMDDCTCFGTVRWFAPGFNNCPGAACGQGMGACCLASGLCQSASESDCASLGGAQWTAGALCCETDCGAVPVEAKTWGSIRANYR